MQTKMSTGRWATIASLFSAALLLAGCEGPPERLNAPPQGQSDQPSALQDNYVRMVDNALLNERSMSPVHFVPGSVELNASGARRLKRYATLLKVYGGELNYDGVDDPPALAEQRVLQIRDFLTAEGVGPDQVTVAVAVAGGRGMRSGEAEAARAGMTATPQTVGTAHARIVAGSEDQK